MRRKSTVLRVSTTLCLLLVLASPETSNAARPIGECCKQCTWQCIEKESGQKLRPQNLGSIKRLHSHTDIFLASQPSPADLEELKKQGIKTVIDQRHEREIADFDEKAIVTSLGMAYHNVPFKGSKELTDEVLDTTRKLLRTAPRPILIHCSSANRTGAIWLAYRILDDDLDEIAALREAKTVGLRSPDYEKVVKNYVERRKGVDPESRDVALGPRTIAALKTALEDERKAEAFYQAVIERFGSRRPFSRIIEAERRHQEALISLFKKYDLAIPARKSADDKTEVPATFEAACRQAAKSEIDNIAMYDRLLREVLKPDARKIMQRLQAASKERHLPAFQRQIRWY